MNDLHFHIPGQFSAKQQTFGIVNHNLLFFSLYLVLCIYSTSLAIHLLVPLAFYHVLMLKHPRIVSHCTFKLSKMAHTSRSSTSGFEYFL